jgi:hypothetical protein
MKVRIFIRFIPCIPSLIQVVVHGLPGNGAVRVAQCVIGIDVTSQVAPSPAQSLGKSSCFFFTLSPLH